MKTEGGRAATSPPVIVIGFVGGFVGHDNTVHSPVQLGQRLRKEYPEGVYVEVFENRRREEAYRKIQELLGSSEGRAKAQHYINESGGKPPDPGGTSSAPRSSQENSGGWSEDRRDGKENEASVSEGEKRQARIIIYGMSWGGSEAISLARELKEQKIPVLLTIQVDSVGKVGEDDGVIPANVAEAVNFYQTDGWLHGRPEIRAEDASRTRILGNFRYSYKTNALMCKGYPWWDRVLTKSHTEIECDPAVWGRVEGLIREKLRAVGK